MYKSIFTFWESQFTNYERQLPKIASCLIVGMHISGCQNFDDKQPNSILTHSAKAKGSLIATVELSNPLNIVRDNESLYWSFYDLGVSDTPLAVSVLRGQQVLPSELIDVDGDSIKDGVIVVLDMAPSEVFSIQIFSSQTPTPIQKLTQAEISVKTGGTWVPRKLPDGTNSTIVKDYQGGEFVNRKSVTLPEFYQDHSQWIRYEGPGIESDKVGYRVYLDERNGFDIYGKKQPAMALQNVGLDGYESYHHEAPWGMDILKVGPSLGAGGFAHWDNGKLVHFSDVESRTGTIIENANLYSSFNIEYKNERLNKQVATANALLTMHAGSRLVHNTLTFDKAVDPIAIGIVKHQGTELLKGKENIPGDTYTYIASWGQQSLDGSDLGMAVFYRPRNKQLLTETDNSYVVVMDASSKEVEYYFSAAWEKEAGSKITDKAAFRQYLDETAMRLTQPIRVRIKTEYSKQQLSSLGTDIGLSISEKLADSELQRKTLHYHAQGWDINRKRVPKFEYDIVGLLPYAYDELGKANGNSTYAQVKYATTATFIEDNGDIENYTEDSFNIDAVAPGRSLLKLYKETGLGKYKKALDLLRNQLKNQPKTKNGAFWHKKKYQGQLWLDGVYMGMPFLAEYSMLFEDGKSLSDVMHEFEVTKNILRDPKTGLYYHGWDEFKKQSWADPKTGLSQEFWARGVGWLSMALVDVLELLPDDQPEYRKQLSAMALDLALTLKKYQDSTGTWWQILDKPNSAGNYRESSASAMFVYFFAKAAELGVLTNENFDDDVNQFVRKSYLSLVNEFVLFHPDGKVSMTNQCLVAGLGYGRDGSYNYYMSEQVVENDPKGIAPLILAGVEVSNLLKQGNDNE